MKRIAFFMSVLLSLSMFCACSSDDVVDSTTTNSGDSSSENDEKTDSTKLESYICGTIQFINHEELGNYVFINELRMPEGEDNYNYIETVVVSKDEFPLQQYQTGDVIYFIIVEVKSEFPPFRDAMHSYPPSKEYLCSIELHK